MSNLADFSGRAMSFDGPARNLRAVIPDDAYDLPNGIARALFVGGAGSVAILDASGTQTTLKSAAHQYHPVCVSRILATGTTATDIVALY